MRLNAVSIAVVVSSMSASPALGRTTVAVAPFSTTSSQEYQWIGSAIADALSLRIHRQDDINAVTVRQVNAAMRQGNIDVASLGDEKVAFRLGLEVGSDLFVTGTYTAAWPDIDVMLVILDPRQKKVVSTQTFTADLDKITEVEARAAEALATALGAKSPKVVPGAFGTKKLRAWRSTILALEILNWQSLTISVISTSSRPGGAAEGPQFPRRRPEDRPRLWRGLGRPRRGAGARRRHQDGLAIAWQGHERGVRPRADRGARRNLCQNAGRPLGRRHQDPQGRHRPAPWLPARPRLPGRALQPHGPPQRGARNFPGLRQDRV